MAKIVERDQDGNMTTKGDTFEEPLEVAYQQLAQAESQVKQTQKEWILKIVQDALRCQGQHLLKSLESQVLATIKEKISNHFEEMILSVEKRMQKLEKSTLEKLRKLEEKVVEIDQRPQLVVGKKRESGVKDVASRVEDTERLAKDTASSLDLLSTRIASLENQICTRVVPATLSPTLAVPTSDIPLVSSSVFSPSLSDISPTASTSVLFSSKFSVERSISSSSLRSSWECNDLLLAIRQCNVQHAMELLQGGAAAKLTKREINELLYEAVKAGHDTVVSLLLNTGADCNSKNCNGETPLHVATENKRLSIISILLKGNCNVNAQNCDGVAALHLATRTDLSGECVALLLNKRADVAVKTVRGDTPLHWAAMHGNVAAIQALLRARASRKVRNNCGKVPWDLAEASLARLLLHPGSKCK